MELGLPVDSREYGIGAHILVDLGISAMRLMTNNPAKYGGLEGFGLEIVDRVPLAVRPNPENIHYLRTKRERLGHFLDDLEDGAQDSEPVADGPIGTGSMGTGSTGNVAPLERRGSEGNR